MKKNKYELGGTCRNGHLLSQENVVYRRQHKSDTPTINCRACKAQTDRAYRLKNQAHIQARQLEWSKRNPEKKWATSRRNHLKRNYGITPEQFEQMWSEQKGLCAVCEEAPDTMRKDIQRPHWLSLYVDHCHTTGTVRGLLCWHCNCALGHLRDDQKRIKALLAYLRTGRSATSLRMSSVALTQSPSNL